MSVHLPPLLSPPLKLFGVAVECAVVRVWRVPCVLSICISVLPPLPQELSGLFSRLIALQKTKREKGVRLAELNDTIKALQAEQRAFERGQKEVLAKQEDWPRARASLQKELEAAKARVAKAYAGEVAAKQRLAKQHDDMVR